MSSYNLFWHLFPSAEKRGSSDACSSVANPPRISKPVTSIWVQVVPRLDNSKSSVCWRPLTSRALLKMLSPELTTSLEWMLQSRA